MKPTEKPVLWVTEFLEVQTGVSVETGKLLDQVDKIYQSWWFS